MTSSVLTIDFRTTNRGSSSAVPTTMTIRWSKVGLVLIGLTASLCIRSCAFCFSSQRNARPIAPFDTPTITAGRNLPLHDDVIKHPTCCTSRRLTTSMLRNHPHPTATGRRAVGRTTLSASGGSSSSPAGSFFTDYHGPIVLVGRSTSTTSTASELDRLAQSLREDLGYPVQKVTASSTQPVSLQDLSERGDGGISRLLSWNGVLVLDLANFEHDNDVKDQYRRAVSTLYQSRCLCIYVNVVEPVNGVADEEGWDAFFESTTDYEVVVKSPIDDSDDDKSAAAGSAVGECTWSHLQWEIVRLLGRAQLPAAVPGSEVPTVNTAHLTMGTNTFFLSLSFPSIEQAQPYVESMCQDLDAMEYRVDLLSCRDSRAELIHGMQLLRQYCRPHASRVPALSVTGSTSTTTTAAGASQVLEDVMPIVYTVRTKNQAGTYPDDDAGITNMFTLLEWGLRAGVEVLDVESAWSPDATDALLDKAEERYSSQVLGSHHVVGREVTTEDAVVLFEQCQLSGRAHGAKVVLSIESDEKDRMAYEAALIASELARAEDRPVIPHVSLILGDVGQFSRVINLPFTPVTHESLPFKAAPGQMTSNEIMATRLLTKIFEPKKYAILGHNIAYSVSPQMHGAAFAATRLPHEYVRVDVATVEEFVESPLFRSSDFGGTSVTIPHKQAIIPHVDVMSQEASDIGSVNTLIVKQEFDGDDFQRVVYGDNTDWRGIFNPLRRLLGSRLDGETDFALILGAGGTARAAAYVASQKLGLQCVYYNRTPSKAQELVDSFGGSVLASLDILGEGSLGEFLNQQGAMRDVHITLRAVISTLPAAAKFTLPEWIYERSLDTKPVVFDVNYKPFNTDLLQQADKMGCNIVRGSEMLWEQGVGQFELWTGRTAPYRVMKQLVLDNCVEAMSQV